jgi:mRNA degradation ribonuclease J1/J2
VAVGKETLSEFLKDMKNWPDVIQRNAILIFNRHTEFAKSESQRVAPFRSGELQKWVITQKAKMTDTGIKSAYVFIANNNGFNYPWVVNKGVRNGKELKISKRINAYAQKRFAEHGVDSVSDDLMEAMGDLVSEVFLK